MPGIPPLNSLRPIFDRSLGTFWTPQMLFGDSGITNARISANSGTTNSESSANAGSVRASLPGMVRQIRGFYTPIPLSPISDGPTESSLAGYRIPFSVNRSPTSRRGYISPLALVNTSGASQASFGSVVAYRPRTSDGSASTSSLNAVQRANGSTNEKANTQNEFDPEKFDPTNLSFKETYNILSKCDLDKHEQFVRDTILKYSLVIFFFPACPDEDLMLAVYFYFEEKFNIKANFEICTRFGVGKQKKLVGIILDSIQTKEEILRQAGKRKRQKIKIRANDVFYWIMDAYCGS